AGGGLGTLKLLLLAQREHPGLFGPTLGRGYMGHVTGSIAMLAPANPADVGAFAFRPLPNGVIVRRRLRPTMSPPPPVAILTLPCGRDTGGPGPPPPGSAGARARYPPARPLPTTPNFRRSDARTPPEPHLKNVARAPFNAAAGLAKTAASLASAKLTGRHR